MSQRYLVTARKYRPMLFGELVAQEHVTETLKNAIRLNRLAHAYLFSGPRGVGKTTAARILAKAINCTTPPEQRIDAAEPCRQCESCRSFEEGRNLNIFEIDAASNNKVEDVRELRDTVRIPPQGSRKKVYIIDEVHMLSNAAFNALLKTLEEPPPYVLFIFATTEPNKVLPTILSRCQRFDFRRIPVPEIVTRLEGICAEEGIRADEASLVLIARKGDGALRDSLSAFDQAVSLCGDDLRYTELAQALGVVDTDLFFETSRYVHERDSAGMLRLVDNLVRSGYDLQEFLSGLAEHLRNLLVALTTGDTSLIEATEATRQRYAENARLFEESELLRLLMVAGDTEEALKNSTHPRLKLETGLLKMVGLSRAADLRQALQKLESLEQLAREGKLNGSTEAAASHAPATREPARPAAHPLPEPSSSPQVATSGHNPQSAIRNPQSALPDFNPQPAASERNPQSEIRNPQSVIHHLHPPQNAPVADDEPPHTPEPEQSAPAPRPALSLFGAPALSLARPPQNPRPGPTGPTGPAAMFAGSGALAVVPDVQPSATADLEEIRAVWPDFVQQAKQVAIRVGAVLGEGEPVALESGTLTVTVPTPFHKQLLEDHRDVLHRHLAALTSVPVSYFQYIVRNDPAPDQPAGTAKEEVNPAEYLKQRAAKDPVVRAIIEHFGGEIVW